MLNVQEKVSQMGHNALLRQKNLFAIMTYYFGQFLKWQRSPCQELGRIHLSMTNPRVSFVKSFEKDRILLHNVSKSRFLSQSTTFYKDKSHILKYMKAFPCTKGDYFKVYKHSRVLFPGRKIHFSAACLKVWSKMIITLLNVNLYINVSIVQKIHRINHCERKLF